MKAYYLIDRKNPSVHIFIGSFDTFDLAYDFAETLTYRRNRWRVGSNILV